MEFSCGLCQEVFGGFRKAQKHISTSSHYRFKAGSNDVACERCGMMNVADLVVLQFGGNKLDLVCRRCAGGVKSMREYALGKTDNFLKIVADYYVVKKAGPGDDDDYLAKVTGDDQYRLRDRKKGKGRSFGKPSRPTAKRETPRGPKGPKDFSQPEKGSQTTQNEAQKDGPKPQAKPSSKPEKPLKSKKVSVKGPKGPKGPKEMNGRSGKNQPPTAKAKATERGKTGGAKQKPSPTPSVSAPSINSQIVLVEQLIRSTATEIPLKYESLPEYFHHLCYGLFLEELFETQFLTRVTVTWSRENPYGEFTAEVDKREAEEYSKNDPLSHLKNGPFSRGQAFFLVRKSAVKLAERPEFWCCAAQFSKMSRNSNKVTVPMDVYKWNLEPIPSGAPVSGFALLPCGAVVTRVMQAIERLENTHFKDMLLGQKPIRQIFFKNRIASLKNTLNESQSVALQSALNNQITILKGPPGSGKTSTIYEMILQLLDQLHYHPILVVAASNIAVDNIAEKMMKDHKDDIIRVLSMAKESEYNKDHPLADICLHHKIRDRLPSHAQDTLRNLATGKAHKVSKNQFKKLIETNKDLSRLLIGQAKVIFSTTVAIGGPHLRDLAQLPVVIIDEATQSSEPSSLIPLAAPNVQKVIFVGDEAQLSSYTRVKSLEMSLFERTLKNGTYQSPLMFDTQYRMHPDISEFPRMEFYEGKLKDGITAEDRKVAGISYPVFFWDHAGDARESRVRSLRVGEETGYTYVNRGEVERVSRIVETLVVDKQIAPSRIGVITPYAGQRDLISASFKDNLLINPEKQEVQVQVDKEDVESESKAATVHQVNGILVASIDAFQGREKDFIVMSCVRSNTERNIGFLRDRRRLNVALTRARCSLLFVGDAHCLKGDQLWRSYIEGLERKNYVQQKLVY
ncbi:hypothetical protein KL909_005015 [Ogataea angusta]|nr:hypothetical protein KL909_005015 [Ogataea angusta]